MWKTLLLIIGILFIIRGFLIWRRKIIAGKIRSVKIDPEELLKLRFLAGLCWERAVNGGINPPTKNVAVVRIDDDPYTWVILKLGIRDREIYRCRMSIEDVVEASKYAKENIEMKEEGT